MPAHHMALSLRANGKAAEGRQGNAQPVRTSLEQQGSPLHHAEDGRPLYLGAK
jgi:hypothetical protein